MSEVEGLSTHTRRSPASLPPARLLQAGRPGGGRPLPAALRSQMERQLGHNFENVRIHASGDAESLGAHALAHGEDIHFRAGAFRPESRAGRRRLAHELAHVVQQRMGRALRGPRVGPVIDLDLGLEREAERAGRRASDDDRTGSQGTLDHVAPARVAPSGPGGTIQGDWFTADGKRNDGDPPPGWIEQVDGRGVRYWMPPDGPNASKSKVARRTTSLFARRAEAVGASTVNDTATANVVSKGRIRVKQNRQYVEHVDAYSKAPSGPKANPDASAFNLGIRGGEHPRMVARSVASSRLDKLLGTNALADEYFVGDRRQYGGASAQAPGREVMLNRGKKKVENEYHPQVQELRRVDYARAETQRGFANLQLIDYLSGQSDRHPGNIVVDPVTGRVTGIDNDQAFGNPAVERARLHNAHQVDVGSVPRLIDHASAQNVLGHKSADVRKLLEGSRSDPERLERAEIDAAVQRFKVLKRQIKNSRELGPDAGGSEIVGGPQWGHAKEWGQRTYQRAQGQANVFGQPYHTYLGRQVATEADVALGPMNHGQRGDSLQWRPATNAEGEVLPGIQQPEGMVVEPDRAWRANLQAAHQQMHNQPPALRAAATVEKTWRNHPDFAQQYEDEPYEEERQLREQERQLREQERGGGQPN